MAVQRRDVDQAARDAAAAAAAARRAAGPRRHRRRAAALAVEVGQRVARRHEPRARRAARAAEGRDPRRRDAGPGRRDRPARHHRHAQRHRRRPRHAHRSRRCRTAPSASTSRSTVRCRRARVPTSASTAPSSSSASPTSSTPAVPCRPATAHDRPLQAASGRRRSACKRTSRSAAPPSTASKIRQRLQGGRSRDPLRHVRVDEHDAHPTQIGARPACGAASDSPRRPDESLLHRRGRDARALRRRISTSREGEYVSIAGPSGCGKSTLLSILGLLDTPTGGRVHAQRHARSRRLDAAERARIRNREIGFIFQSFNLIGDLTVVRERRAAADLSRHAARPSASSACSEALERVGMAHRDEALSGAALRRPAAARRRRARARRASRRSCSPTSRPATSTRRTARR